MTLRSLACPSCGSPDVEAVSPDTRRCRHCGTESRLSADRTRLELVQWLCPTCGFNNESGARFCGRCGASLAKRCPECSAILRTDLDFCGSCGANYRVAMAEEQARQAELAERMAEERTTEAALAEWTRWQDPKLRPQAYEEWLRERTEAAQEGRPQALLQRPWRSREVIITGLIGLLIILAYVAYILLLPYFM